MFDVEDALAHVLPSKQETRMTRILHLGTFIEGVHSAHWRDEGVPPDSLSNIHSFIEFARLAESAKFDFGFIADSEFITKESAWSLLSRLEPITALAALSTATTNIGLAGTVSTSYTQPWTVARQFASLDLISGGRAGWNVVTSAAEGVGRNFSLDRLQDHDHRYRIAEEHVEVVKGLWASWGDGAFVRDRETGQYFDPEQLYTLNHKGENFRVQGPLNIERSPQGRPIIFQAGASPSGKRLAARTADAVYAPPPGDFDEAQASYAEWKRLAAEVGRNPDELLILPNFQPIVGATRVEAHEAWERTVAHLDVEHALKFIARYFNGYDFTKTDYNAPFPTNILEFAKGGLVSVAEGIVSRARRENLTIAQAALVSTLPPKDFVGTAADVADRIERYFTEGAADGFVVTLSKENLSRFIDYVVPVLQDRGLFRTDYNSTTLRGHLGLPFPHNPPHPIAEPSVESLEAAR